MSDDREGLTPEERSRLERLPREVSPPDALEDRVVASLAREGLLSGSQRAMPAEGRIRPRRFGGGRPARLLAAAALAAVALGAGYWAGRRSAPPLPGTEPSFLLALYEGPEFEPFTDENSASRYEDYNRWIAGLRGDEQFVTGLPLDSSGYVVLPESGETRLENRFPRTEDGWVDGLFVVRAQDYDEALRLARSAPHLRYGGRIAVRRISPI